jgi:ADP-ribose pyrophosphatase YjhB (NUDIX family)
MLTSVPKLGVVTTAGGGVDLGQTLAEAAERETLEELGVRIQLQGHIGVVEEHIISVGLHQLSYCYWGKQLTSSGDSMRLSQLEQAQGMAPVTAIDLFDAASYLPLKK